MSINLRIANGCGPTGRILTQLIRQAGCEISPQGRAVSWGCTLAGGLNANAGRLDKYEQLVRLRDRGVRVPDHVRAHNRQVDSTNPNPIVYLARKLRHVGGKDIMPVLQFEDFAARVAAGAEFFTRYIPSSREFRVWVYRRRHLGTYEKVLRYPERYKKIGRNYGNGFVFQLVQSEQVPRPAVEIACAAVTALDLDFGAVDMILGIDGQYYVLEVNTAPGVEGEGRQVIQALAQKIATWDRLGHPRRDGDTVEPTRSGAPVSPRSRSNGRENRSPLGR